MFGSWRHRLICRFWRLPDHPMKLRTVRWLRKLLRLDFICGGTSSNVRLWLDPDDYVQRNILLHGNYEIESVGRVRLLVRNVSTFLDIGAHIGLYSLEAADAMQQKGTIISVEANPSTFQVLIENVQLNAVRNVFPVLGYLGGGGLIGMEEPEASNSGKSRRSATAADYWVASLHVADLLQTFDCQPQVVKVDVEGAELSVLHSLLACCLPTDIIFEFIPENLGGDTHALLDLFRKHGYQLRDVSGKEFSGERPIEDNIWASRPKS